MFDVEHMLWNMASGYSVSDEYPLLEIMFNENDKLCQDHLDVHSNIKCTFYLGVEIF